MGGNKYRKWKRFKEGFFLGSRPGRIISFTIKLK